jgi:hypothetical protein
VTSNVSQLLAVSLKVLAGMIVRLQNHAPFTVSSVSEVAYAYKEHDVHADAPLTALECSGADKCF